MKETRECPALAGISGAWIQNDYKAHIKMGVRAEFDFGNLTPRIKNRVVIGLRTGVLDTTSGMAKAAFTLLSNHYKLRWTAASRTGSWLIAGYRHPVLEEQLASANALIIRSNSRIYPHGNGFCIYGWRARTEVARNLYEQTIGFDDKELREKAIDFMCEGGILTHAWIDPKPI